MSMSPKGDCVRLGALGLGWRSLIERSRIMSQEATSQMDGFSGWLLGLRK